MYKIYSIGELLKDVHFHGLSAEQIRNIQPSDIPHLTASGKIKSADDAGAPGNVAVYFSLLGGKSDLLACVGRDKWGDEIIRDFAKYRVSIRVRVRERGQFTDSSLIYDGEKGHEFIKFLWGSMPSINDSHVEADRISDSDIIHIGSVAPCMFPGFKSAIEKATDLAKKNRKLVSTDLNLRAQIYKTPEARYEKAIFLAEKSNMLKLSGSELLFLSHFNPGIRFNSDRIDLEELVRLGIQFKDIYNSDLLLVTLGQLGAIGFSGEFFSWASSYDFGRPKNTIGAGDAFIASAIMQSLNLGLYPGTYLSSADLTEVINFGCQIAGISVTGDKTITPEVAHYRKLEGRRRYASYQQFSRASKPALQNEMQVYRQLIE